MASPWLKKNPFMSMWLSAFNAAAGSMRGHAVSQAKRQTASAITTATKDIFGAWTGGLAPPPARNRRRKRR